MRCAIPIAEKAWRLERHGPEISLYYDSFNHKHVVRVRVFRDGKEYGHESPLDPDREGEPDSIGSAVDRCINALFESGCIK